MSTHAVTNVGNYNTCHLLSLPRPHLVKSACQASEVGMKFIESVGIPTQVLVPPEPVHFPTCHLNSKLSCGGPMVLESPSCIYEYLGRLNNLG